MAGGHSRHPRLVLPVGERDHAQGPADAPATLVEYGDYECAFCGQADPVVRAVQARLAPRLRFVFRHFPLTEIHPHGQAAAEAAEAAGAQGRFWPMHEVLYAQQAALDDADLLRYAGRLGLDQQRFVDELSGHRHEARVREHFMSGVRSGVNGTPTFFINGVRHDGPWDVDTLTEALRAAGAAAA
jgi:protein-disulfide isomerase